MIINCVIVGLGNVGMIYDHNDHSDLIQSHAKAASSHQHFNLLAGIDSVQEKRNLFEKNYKKLSFKNIEEFKSDSQVDLVIVATPTETHLSIIKKSLIFLKPRMILCEKPLSYSFKDAEEIINLCKKSEVELFVNYMRRCDPGVIEIKKKIDKKYIKSPVKGICWYSKGLYNNCSHFINLLEFWLGDFKELKIIKEGRILNNYDIEPEFFLAYEKGSIIFRSAWEEYFSFSNIEIISESGILQYKYGGEQINLFDVEDDKRFFGYKKIGEKNNKIKSGMKIYQYNVLEEIFKSCNGEDTTICKGEEALKTQKIIYLLSKNLRN